MNKNIYLFVIIVILLSFALYKSYHSEGFAQQKSILNNNIHCIILDNDEKDDTKQSLNNYIGSFIKSGSNSDPSLGRNLFNSYSLESNKWNILEDDLLNKNDKTIIIDLSYDKMRRLMAVGLHYNSNNEPKYNIYRKKNQNLKSKWIKLTKNPDINIISLCYDSRNSKLLAVNNDDGQIYEAKLFDNYDKWIGPINFDKPVKKIMYDSSNFLIGIDKEKGYILRKSDINWRTSKWSDKVNETSVQDLIYDIDGCFIATTSDGIKKQFQPDFLSKFGDIKTYDKTHKEILSKVDILKYKIGFEFLDEIFNETPLGKHFKKIYNIKKLTKDLCNRRKYNKQFKLNKDITNEIAIKNRELNDLNDRINTIIQKFDK